MNKLAFASLGLLALVSAAGTTLASGGTADLGLDPNRLYFTYQAPSGGLTDLHMTPNTEHNPLLLPCDVTLFGGQLDIDYPGAGPTVYPRVTFSLFTESGAAMTGSGCTGIPLGPDASPQIMPKISLKAACAVRISPKAVIRGTSRSSRILGIARYQ